jgi:glycine oxidase
VPRQDGTLVVGATVEERGFDLTVHAGAVGDLLNDARRLVPSLEEYELYDTATGLRPGSPDNAPIVGASDIPGLVVATGHYRNGFLLAPVTAGEVVRILTGAGAASRPGGGREPGGGHPPVSFAPFRPGRFAMTGPTGARVGRPDVSAVGT